MTSCKLCDLDLPLRDSHIIPEFAYRSLYEAADKKSDRDGRFFPIIMGREVTCADIAQKGYRQDLLCSGCENKFSKWEGCLRNLLFCIQNKKSRHNITVSPISLPEGRKVYKVQGFNYHCIRMALLSVLWRLSISDLEIFKAYNLGKAHAGRIKNILYEDQFIPMNLYPTFLATYSLGDASIAGFQKFGTSERVETLNAQVFTICATEVTTVVSNQTISDQLSEYCIQESSAVYVIEKSLTSPTHNNAKLRNRLLGSDVERMYRAILK